ncbi:MAG: sugar phosphate isomerase/epimerase [Eudoraea sp.]|jgi:sugar phosphate isomerase/epimerase|uniref:sugar phosphate isomerase/epimerase family protein n=1 Tax=Eudoraea sp. TaxID=1979955 RepID=UPI0035FFB788
MMKKNNILIMGVAILCCQFSTYQIVAQEVGLQLYSLRNQFKTDVPGTLKLVNEWGITKIEGGGSYGLPMDEYKKLLKDNNLEMVSVGAGYEDLQNDIEKVVQNAKTFGAKYVMCAWIPHDGNTFDIAKTKEATEVFNKAGKRLKEEGITLAYHAHGYEFRPYEDGTLFDYMAKNANHFAFEMDVYWVHHGGGDPLALLNRYPDKVVLLHLKDMEHGIKGNDTGHEDVETNVVLGTGQVDIAGVVKRSKELGFVKYMFIEDECSRVVEQVPQSLKFLKTL